MLTRREGQAQYLHVKKSLNENYLNHFGKHLVYENLVWLNYDVELA